MLYQQHFYPKIKMTIYVRNIRASYFDTIFITILENLGQLRLSNERFIYKHSPRSEVSNGMQSAQAMSIIFANTPEN